MDTKTKYVVNPNYLFPVPCFQILLRLYINNNFFKVQNIHVQNKRNFYIKFSVKSIEFSLDYQTLF